MSTPKNKILIDIGHARGTGANGTDVEGVTYNEHEVCELLAIDLALALKKQGIDSVIIDYAEYTNSQDLNKTINTANELTKSESTDYDFGVSLHMDASDNTDAHGGHVCYYMYSDTKGKYLAKAVADQLVVILPGRANATVGRLDLAVLKDTIKPWILIENGFITNQADLNTMITSFTRAEVADALAVGIKNALKYL